ncbi:hypothetical protein KI387_042289, partial [Taxus chinensis]
MDVMQTIMSLMLNEFEEPPYLWLSILMEGLGQEGECISHTLARKFLDRCSSKVKRCIQGMSSFVFDDKFLASNDCMYLSGCKEKSNMVDGHEEDIDNKHIHDEEEMVAKEPMMDKSYLRYIIHLYHDPFEEQEGSVSIMVTLSHFPPSMSMGKVEKRALDEEKGEENSVVPNLEILSFVDVGSSPRYDFSYFISPSILSFDGYTFEHDREMGMMCNMGYNGHILI